MLQIASMLHTAFLWGLGVSLGAGLGLGLLLVIWSAADAAIGHSAGKLSISDASLKELKIRNCIGTDMLDQLRIIAQASQRCSADASRPDNVKKEDTNESEQASLDVQA